VHGAISVKRSALALLLGVLCLGAAPARVATLPADFGDRVDALVRAELASQHVPGIAVGVAVDGTVVLDRGYGSRDLANSAPVDGATRFALGSITKSFTAAVTMQLAAAHRLALDDHLDRYVPDAPHARELTIRQLLTQRSGLADYVNGSADMRGIALRTDVTPAELLVRIATEPLGFAPGTHFAYSNTNYLLLGLVIERVLGTPYDRDLLRGVLGPAHLDGISYGRPDGADVATGYVGSGPAPLWSSAVTRAAGALWGDVGGLLRFDEAFFDGRIVAPPLVATMTAEGAPLGASDYAYGWFVSDLGGHRDVWHGGRVPGFVASNSVFPADRIAIVVLGNSDTFRFDPIVRGILALIDPAVGTRAPPPAPVPLDDPPTAAFARIVFHDVQQGTIDRTKLTASTNAALTDALVKSVGAQLAALGEPTAFTLRSRSYFSNVQLFVYRLQFAAFAIDETLGLDGSGKITVLLFRPASLAPAPVEPDP